MVMGIKQICTIRLVQRSNSECRGMKVCGWGMRIRRQFGKPGGNHSVR